MTEPKHAITTDRTKWAAFTPERRKAVYGVVAALLALGTTDGLIAPENATQWLEVANQGLGVIALVLAAIHTGGVYESPVLGDKDE